MPTYDAAIFQPNTPKYDAALFVSKYPGRKLTGTEKLAQRYIIEMFTDIASMLYKQNRGGNFWSYLKSGMINEQDVFQAFYLAKNKTAENLKAEERDSDPDDERYGDSSLSNISITPDSYKMTISITSIANTRVNIIWPVLIEQQSDNNDFATLGDM